MVTELKHTSCIWASEVIGCVNISYKKKFKKTFKSYFSLLKPRTFQLSNLPFDCLNCDTELMSDPQSHCHCVSCWISNLNVHVSHWGLMCWLWGDTEADIIKQQSNTCEQLEANCHLDSEGPSLSLWVQTLISEIQQDLEMRQWPTVEPVTLDLW